MVICRLMHLYTCIKRYVKCYVLFVITIKSVVLVLWRHYNVTIFCYDDIITSLSSAMTSLPSTITLLPSAMTSLYSTMTSLFSAITSLLWRQQRSSINLFPHTSEINIISNTLVLRNPIPLCPENKSLVPQNLYFCGLILLPRNSLVLRNPLVPRNSLVPRNPLVPRKLDAQ